MCVSFPQFAQLSTLTHEHNANGTGTEVRILFDSFSIRMVLTQMIPRPVIPGHKLVQIRSLLRPTFCDARLRKHGLPVAVQEASGVGSSVAHIAACHHPRIENLAQLDFGSSMRMCQLGCTQLWKLSRPHKVYQSRRLGGSWRKQDRRSGWKTIEARSERVTTRTRILCLQTLNERLVPGLSLHICSILTVFHGH